MNDSTFFHFPVRKFGVVWVAALEGMASDLHIRLWVEGKCPTGLGRRRVGGAKRKRRSARRMILSKIPLCCVDCVVSNWRFTVGDAFGN